MNEVVKIAEMYIKLLSSKDNYTNINLKMRVWKTLVITVEEVKLLQKEWVRSNAKGC